MLQFVSWDTILHEPDPSKTQLRCCLKICRNLGSSVFAQVHSSNAIADDKSTSNDFVISSEIAVKSTVLTVIESVIDKSLGKISFKRILTDIWH